MAKISSKCPLPWGVFSGHVFLKLFCGSPHDRCGYHILHSWVKLAARGGTSQALTSPGNAKRFQRSDDKMVDFFFVGLLMINASTKCFIIQSPTSESPSYGS